MGLEGVTVTPNSEQEEWTDDWDFVVIVSSEEPDEATPVKDSATVEPLPLLPMVKPPNIFSRFDFLEL